MKSTFEKLGGTYKQVGDYLLPDVEAPESPNVGIWGLRRHKYLREHKKVLYTGMLLTGKMNAHLEEIDQSANEMFDSIVEQLKLRDGITEGLKAQHQMEWVQRMNNVKNQATEIVNGELIFGLEKRSGIEAHNASSMPDL